jgi:manganese/zinc/iron transport system permease protein
MLADYTVRTVAVGAAILGIVSGTLGAFAVLRRQSLLGDAISHAALPGICIGFLIAGTRDLSAIMAGALAAGVLAALAVLAIERRTRLKSDAALAIVLSVFFAAGIVLLTRVQAGGNEAQAGLESFLFGQAAAILRSDLWVMTGVAASALALVGAFWKEFKLVTFDPGYARSLGMPVLVLEVALTVMLALAIVVGLQIVGVVLMTAMLIAPAAAARQWTGRLETMVALSAGFGVVAGVAGSLLSATGRGLATGPLVILIASAIVLVSLLLAPGRGLLWEWAETRRARAALAERGVLLTLHALGASHADPAYPAERGMLDAYHGRPSDRALATLEAQGMVRRVNHPPESTLHWELTGEGRAEAERLVRSEGAP